jgi:hypothetical protein
MIFGNDEVQDEGGEDTIDHQKMDTEEAVCSKSNFTTPQGKQSRQKGAKSVSNRMEEARVT